MSRPLETLIWLMARARPLPHMLTLTAAGMKLVSRCTFAHLRIVAYTQNEATGTLYLLLEDPLGSWSAREALPAERTQMERMLKSHYARITPQCTQ